MSQELAAMDEPKTGGGDPQIGRIIRAKYRLTSTVAEGELGNLYAAQQLSTGNTVAVKVFHPALSANGRFAAGLRELMMAVRGLSRNAPHIVSVYDCDQTEDGSLFIAMELVEGRSLAEIIRQEHPLSIERAVRLAGQMAEGLSLAHDFGIVHGDVRPNKFIVTGKGEAIKIVGFERARLRDLAPVDFLGQSEVLTKRVAYLSPEQIRGEAVTPLTDVYALGAVFYEMLSGSVPFQAPTPNAVLTKHLHEPPAPLKHLRPEVPEVVEAKVLQALAKEPARRENYIKDVANESLYDLALYYQAARRETAEQESGGARAHIKPSETDADPNGGMEDPAPSSRRWKMALLSVFVVLMASAGLWTLHLWPASEPVEQSGSPPDPASVQAPATMAPPISREPVQPKAAPAPNPPKTPAGVRATREATTAPATTEKKRIVPVRNAAQKSRQAPSSPPRAQNAQPASKDEAGGTPADPGAVIDWLLKRAPVSSE